MVFSNHTTQRRKVTVAMLRQNNHELTAEEEAQLTMAANNSLYLIRDDHDQKRPIKKKKQNMIAKAMKNISIDVLAKIDREQVMANKPEEPELPEQELPEEMWVPPEELVSEERKARKKKECSYCKAFAEWKCAACRKRRYCGVSCQELDWPQHQKYCEETRANRD